MSEFSCPSFTVERVYKHPNADTLDIVEYEGYKCIVRRDSVKEGDVLAYIPAQSILSDLVLDNLGMRGNSNLRSYNGERRIVRPVRLRGIFSEGLVVPLNDMSAQDIPEDCAALLGIEKYVPPVPVHFQGVVSQKTRGLLHGKIPRFDLESVQKKNAFAGTNGVVLVTEKLHGTQAKYGFVRDESGECVFYVTSKGVGKQGFSYDLDSEKPNVYVEVWRHGNIALLLSAVARNESIEACELTGEIVGVQDLDYGCKEQPTFFAFQLAKKYKGKADWVYQHAKDIESRCHDAHIPTVPILYYGHYSDEAVLSLVDGPTTLNIVEVMDEVIDPQFGRALPFKPATHIREGIVVVSDEDPSVKMKCVSEAYKLRGNGTEHE
jgi:RNA ligase (TIGR02306 family)